MNTCIVYCLICKNSGKKYVGWSTKTVAQRWKAHLRRAKQSVVTKLYSAIRAHTDWELSVLEANLSIEEAKCREIHWISELDTFANGYNMTRGGDGVVLCGEKNPFFGRKHKPESIAKARQTLGDKLSGKNNPQFGQKGEKSPGWGKRHSPETLERIRQLNLGKKRTPEQRQHLREAFAKAKEKRSLSQKLRRLREKEQRNESANQQKTA